MKLYGRKIARDCSYCTKSGTACHKKAERRGKHACLKFKYDPLLRVPKRMPDLPTFTAEDFKI